MTVRNNNINVIGIAYIGTDSDPIIKPIIRLSMLLSKDPLSIKIKKEALGFNILLIISLSTFFLDILNLGINLFRKYFAPKLGKQ